MPKESIEQMIEDLGKTINSLVEENKSFRHEIERLQAVNEIQNLMSRYEYLHVNEKHDEVVELYAKKAPDVRVYYGQLGYYEGYDAPKRAWSHLQLNRPKSDLIGQIHFHPVCNSVIEVAGDGKTAKGVWTTVGIETPRVKGQLVAAWSIGTYGVDFIKEDGVWKFWHFHIYRVFNSDFDHSWINKEGWNPDRGGSGLTYLELDGPAVDDYPYRVDGLTVVKPDPPEPYETWKDTTMY